MFFLGGWGLSIVCDMCLEGDSCLAFIVLG